jgi:tape measure domain-containing protein
MGNLGSLVIKIGADLTSFSTGMQTVQRDLRAFGKEADAMGKKLTMSLTAPIAALGIASLKFAGDIEALKNGLIAVTGSSAAAEAEFKKLREVAKLPGLGLEEAVRGSINLQSIGVSANDARKAMFAMGKAIATVGGGKANFDLAIRGFSQLVNAAKPLQQDLYQIANQVPQVNTLLKEAFGSNRAEDLAKLGLTGKQVADFLVNELGKLPSVAGGINNSFENMGDSIKIAFAQIGEAINKNFNITGLMDKIADSVSNLADQFSNLSPQVQKIILSVAGFAAILGPLLIGLGAVATAIGALSLPVIGFVAAFAAATAAIIIYWDDIVAAITSDSITDAFTEIGSAVYQLYQVFDDAFTLIKGAWDIFGDFILDAMNRMFIAPVKAAFQKLKDLFVSGMDTIINIINIFKGIFKGNWALVWESVLNLGKIFLNKSITLVKSIVDLFMDGVGMIVLSMEKLGIGEKFTAGFREARKSLDTWVEGLKFTTTTSKEAEDALNKLTSSWKTLNSEQSKSNSSDIGSSASVLPSGGINKSAMSSSAALGAMQPLVSAADATGKAVQAAFTAGLEGAQTSLDNFIQTASSAIMDTGLSESIDMLAQKMKNFANTVTQALKDAAVSVIASGAEMLGAALVTGQGLENLPKMILQTLAGLMKQIGVAAIGIGISMEAIQKSFTNPVAAIAAGVALVAASGALMAAVSTMGQGKAKPQAFADGGIIFGPTQALMGEYQGASRNPEVVAPLNKLQSMIGGNDVNVTGEFLLRGGDLIATIKKAENTEGRYS